MRTTTFFLIIIGTGLFAAEGHSQTSKVSITAQNTSVKEVLREIEDQTDYLFIYNPNEVDLDQKTSVQAQDKTVTDVLTGVFNKAETVFLIEGYNIMLMKRPDAQQPNRKRVSGVIIDEKGETIIGASIIEKGLTNGTASDADGRFSLSVSENAVLQIYYIGYFTKEIPTGDQTTFEITLVEDAQAIEEVVVVGYGTQKKRDLTGAVSSVKIAEMPVQTYSTVSHALAGKAAGLQVTQNSAQVGGGATFQIRGATSTGAGNSPLVIIDGIPVSSSSFEGSGNRYSAGTVDNVLESLNPNDIESIDVLKDASATAIYGSRAGHGVIIVTTKRGKNQKVNVTYSGNASVQNMKNSYKMLNAQEYMSQRNKDNYEMYLQNNGLDVYKDYISLAPGHVPPAYVPMFSDAEIAAAKTTDWFDEVTRQGFQQSHNISMNGGTESTQYMASLNYFTQKGVVKNNNLNRFTAKFNLDQQISKYVKAGLSFNLSRNQYDNVALGGSRGENSGIIGSAITFNPTIPIYDANGEYSSNPEQSYLPNPVSLLEITDITTKDRVLGSAYTEVEPVKGLKLKAVLGVDRRISK
ncbi:MAG: SusC/RagA family TonB-linked outer membrane protein, partial [Tannerella sp.]|nr:SusC/RagA family TonB-linked outer membrane protein [Tannerella sp.]